MRRLFAPAASILATCAMFAIASSAPAAADTAAEKDSGVVTIRLAGADRYETAVKVSQYLNPDPSSEPRDVAVVNGTAFPDALAAQNLYESTSSLLMVTRDRVPDVTLQEIKRLKPRKITVIGGTGVIDPAIVRQLDPLATEGARRLGGKDRWETTAKVAVETFSWMLSEMPLFHAELASGVDYPDALTRRWGGPMLLTKPRSLPPATYRAMESLGMFSNPNAITEVTVHGGSGAISEYVLDDLKRAGGNPVRLGGADRYETAALASDYKNASHANEVWFASGEDFPDALSSIYSPSPVLLTRARCVPEITQVASAAFSPATHVIVGGEGIATLSKQCP